MGKNKHLLVSLVAIVSSVAFSSMFAPIKVAALAETMTFSTIGVHPDASSETTLEAKKLNKLLIKDDKIYAGYGDINANTGPVELNPFDLSNRSFDGSQLTVPTEAVSRLRVLNGSIYAPNIDDLGFDSPIGYATNSSGSWAYHSPVTGVHVFDMASLGPNDLWMFGSKVHPLFAESSIASAWHSVDNGVTWSEAITDDSIPAQDGRVARYYWGAALNGKVYTQSKGNSPESPIRIFDGSSWSNGPNEQLCTGSTAVEVFAGKIICAGNTYNEQLRTFDGTSIQPINFKSYESVFDMYVGDDGYFYVLTSNGSMSYSYGLFRTNNLRDWQEITRIAWREDGNDLVSFAVNDGKVYIGTAHSEIQESNQTIDEALAARSSLEDSECYLVYDTWISKYYPTYGNLLGAPACPAGDLVIPSTIRGETITGIGIGAFANSGLTSVIIPNTVTSIGSSAFSGNNLSSVTLPDGLTSIGFATFSENSLVEIKIPPGVTSISDYAFKNNRLTSINLPNGLTSIGSEAFAGNSIRSVIIPAGVQNVQDDVFLGQSSNPNLFEEIYSSSQEKCLEALDDIWYVQLYTADPSNPHNLKDSLSYFNEQWSCDANDDGDEEDSYVISGYLVNPSYAEARFISGGLAIHDPQVFTGEYQGRSLANYLIRQGPKIPLPQDTSSPSPEEESAIADALSSYYRAGQTVALSAISILPFTLLGPQSVSLTLAVGQNIHNFEYRSPFKVLAATGSSMKLYATVAIVSLGAALGVIIVLLRKHKNL